MITSEYKDYFNFDEKGTILTKKPSSMKPQDIRGLVENDYFEKRVRIKTQYITGKTEVLYGYIDKYDVVFLIYNNAVYTLFDPLYEIIEITEQEIF